MKRFETTTRHIAIALVVFGLTLGGCASHQSGSGDAARAAYDVNSAVTAWTEGHDYDRAVRGLEKALDEYQGDSFEQTTLATLALVHLEYGNRDAFLETAERLETTVGGRQYIPRQTQHVLTVAGAMNGQAFSQLPGRGYTDAHGHWVYGLLQVGK